MIFFDNRLSAFVSILFLLCTGSPFILIGWSWWRKSCCTCFVFACLGCCRKWCRQTEQVHYYNSHPVDIAITNEGQTLLDLSSLASHFFQSNLERALAQTASSIVTLNRKSDFVPSVPNSGHFGEPRQVRLYFLWSLFVVAVFANVLFFTIKSRTIR